MSRRKISQRQARAAIARVSELQEKIWRERSLYLSGIPGTHLGTITWTEPALVCEAAWTARKLGFAVAVKPDEDRKTMRLYAVPTKEI